MLLAGNSQSGVLFIVVLNLQGGTVGHQSAVGQTDTQGRTNLGTFDSEAVVVLTVYVASEHQVVLEDFEGFPGDHVNGKNTIRHDASPFKVLAVHLRLHLPHLSSAFSFNPLRRTHGLRRTRISRVV